jgi:SAM-dependent methyltransferase
LAQQEKSSFAEREVPFLLQRFLEKEKWRNYLDLGCGYGSLLSGSVESRLIFG